MCIRDRVGSVSDIQLADDSKSVTLVLKIYKDFPIYHDARFVIEQSDVYKRQT